MAPAPVPPSQVVGQVPSAQALRSLRVAVLLGGPPDVHLHPAIDGALQLKQHILDPLLAERAVGVFVAAVNASGWRELHLQKLLSPSTVVLAEEAPPLRPRQLTRFRDEWQSVIESAEAQWRQYGNLRHAFGLMARFESVYQIKFTHVVKTRIDLYYKPDHFFRPAWLDQLSGRTIATSSTEFQCADRWVDRTDSVRTACFAPPGYLASALPNFSPLTLGQTWPHQMADQLFFGRRSPMQVILVGLFTSRPSRNRSEPFWLAWPFWDTVETVLAEHAIASGLKATRAFELQFRSDDRLSQCRYGCPSLQLSDCGLWVPGRCRRCYFDQAAVENGGGRAAACKASSEAAAPTSNCMLMLTTAPTRHVWMWECRARLSTWFMDLHWQKECAFRKCSSIAAEAKCRTRRTAIAVFCGVPEHTVRMILEDDAVRGSLASVARIS